MCRKSGDWFAGPYGPFCSRRCADVDLNRWLSGTYVVPGHGYLCDEHEVVEYRDMVVIIRDRVQAMINAGATLPQVQAARLTADYDTRYGANSGPRTTAMFVEAVYNSLKQPPAKGTK